MFLLPLQQIFIKNEPHIHNNVCTAVQYELSREGYCDTEPSTFFKLIKSPIQTFTLTFVFIIYVLAVQLTKRHGQDAGPHPEELIVPLTC